MTNSAPQSRGTRLARVVPNVFVSHSSVDVDAAELFATHLSRLVPSANCFVARGADAERIEPGEQWRERIQQAVRDSRALVCLFTTHSRQSAWVNYEIGLADQAEVEVFPLNLDSDRLERDHPASNRQIGAPTPADVASVFRRIAERLGTTVHETKSVEASRAFLTDLFRERNDADRVQAIERAHMKHAVSKIHRYSADAIFEADNARRKQEFRYMQHMLKMVESLREGDEFLAICGDKNLKAIAFDYMNANVDAALRGVRVHRIYVEPRDGFRLEELQIIDCHLEWACEQSCNLRVSVVVGAAAELARREHVLPDGFGLVIPSGSRNEALIHYGLRDEDRRARRFQEPLLVQVYRDIHADINDLSADADLGSWLIEKRWDALDRHPQLRYSHERRRPVDELIRLST